MNRRVAVIFENIGGYHAARLRAAAGLLAEKNLALTAIRISDAQGEHPWGGMNLDFPVETILKKNGALTDGDRAASGPRVAALLEKLRPAAVAIPGWGFAYSRAALAWCRKNHTPGIAMSESKYDDEPRIWWKELFKSQIVRKFSAALVGAQSHFEYLVRLGLPRQKIFRGYDVVDNAHFAARARLARENTDTARSRQPAIPLRPFFLAVTRLIPRKNIARLIEAFAIYRQRSEKISAWDLAICGSGAEEKPLRQLARERGIDRWVHFPGFIVYQEIGDWYGLAGALVHPALQEQWGLVVNEAMAAGLPVLVSNRCGCFPELVREGATGFGFDPENTEQLAALLLRVARGDLDLQKIGNAAAAHIENFSPRHFAEGLLAAIECAAQTRA